MQQSKFRAVFIRGGTSKGVFFRAEDLPATREDRDRIFLTILGSPDPYHRQLDGMGGGLSSVSKVCIIAPSNRAGVDVDYTFVQIAVDQPVADYEQACGNLSSAVGPFAIEEQMVDAPDGEALVRVYNTNTDKVFEARFAVREGRAVETGDFEMSGVPGTGARIRLDYLAPGGAKSAGFLPTGNIVDTLARRDGEPVQVSMVDATNPVVFVSAEDFGVTGTERPEALESNVALMQSLDDLRRQAGVRMGLAGEPGQVPLSNPKIALVASPRLYTALNDTEITPEDFDIAVRIVSMERMHRAVTGTGGMCLAAACQVTGSVPQRIARAIEPGGDVRIATPSGIMTAAAKANRLSDGVWDAERVTVYRTQRRLMEGHVLLPRP